MLSKLAQGAWGGVLGRVIDVGAREGVLGCVGSAWESVLVCVVDFGAREDILGCVVSRELLRGKNGMWEDTSG